MVLVSYLRRRNNIWMVVPCAVAAWLIMLAANVYVGFAANTRIRKPLVKNSRIGMLLAALFIVPLSAEALPDDPGVSQAVAPLFASHSVLPVTIEAPLTTLMRDRPLEEYLDGTFSFTEDDGTQRTIDLKIRTRGKYRRQKKNCNFAPIRLNFRKKQVVDTEFAGQDKLKLVTHCQNSRPPYEQLVLREFLAYRLLNVMTNNSFGVRLLQINYVDTEGANPMTKLGFVIEDDDDVAERNGMYSIKSGDISSDDIDRMEQNFVNVFQYLIGNTEFSLVRAEPDEYCCHNIDLMSATKGAPFTSLPYDFDFAGIVDAPYAEPNPRFKIEDVRHRLFRGLCENNDLLPYTFQQFLNKKDEVYGVVDELELLSPRSKRNVIRYLNAFYDDISQSKSVSAKFIKKCNDTL
jgi:hypothetical protein